MLLDVSKAFYKVSYDMLFQLLIDRNVCPRVIRLLFYMYTNQLYYVKWDKEKSEKFNVSNGVKQGGVLSPLLFSIYIDNLFDRLKVLGLGCHIGGTFAGAYGYADDIALISPSIYGLKKMISVCELYASNYHITFNPIKTKMICFSVSPENVPPIYVNGKSTSIVNNDIHLGNYISSDVHDRNMMKNVCDLYQRSNSVLADFYVCDSETLDSIHMSFCLHMYGCELWNLSNGNSDKYKIAWRKIKRRIWKLPPLAHNTIVHSLTSDFNVLLENRILKFIHNALNHNSVCKHVFSIKLMCKNSCFADNYRYLSYRYDLCRSDWNKDISYLMGKVKMKMKCVLPSHRDSSIVRELCKMRDELDYNILSSEMINTLLTDICIN